jgi:hypothetical protein
VHEAQEPDLLANFFDPDLLSNKQVAEIDRSATDAMRPQLLTVAAFFGVAFLRAAVLEGVVLLARDLFGASVFVRLVSSAAFFPSFEP